MIIEVTGAGFVNKGAELMLRAVRQKVNSRSPHIDLALAMRFGTFRQRAELGFKHILRLGVWRFNAVEALSRKLGGMIPNSARQKFGLLTEADVGAVLDASGFAYGDQQGVIPALRSATNMRRWQRQHKKLILLPQAFGPFENPVLRAAFADVLEAADLVYARDRESYNHIVGTYGGRAKVRLAPDFTASVPVSLPDNLDMPSGQVCIIPNYRMIDRGNVENRQDYPVFLQRCIEYLIRADSTPFLLIHEGSQDLALAERIQRDLEIPIPIVRETDPCRIKGILGLCSFVISSRYHGLISALSQGIPALGTGWSHKYEMLFEDYGCADCLIRDLRSACELRQKLNTMMDSSARARLQQQLSTVRQERDEQTERMWAEIADVLGLSSRD